MQHGQDNTYPAVGVFGFPKSGNTWVGNTFLELGRLAKPGFNSPFDIHVSLRDKSKFLPNPGLTVDNKEYVCFKSHAPRFYKKEIPGNLKELGIGNLEKIIILTRNPFDVLLSFINYSQFESSSCFANGNSIPKELKEFIVDYVGFPEDKIQEKWAKGISFEVLSQQDYLDNALDSFGRFGLSIPMVYGMSSTWSSNILSWKSQNNLPCVTIRYEDLIDDLESEIAKISSFLGIEASFLRKAFGIRNERTLDQRQKDISSGSPSFYNKMTHGYFKEYFSRASLASFCDKHYSLICSCGYEDTVDGIFS